MKVFFCWLLGFGHKDEPYQFVILKGNHKVVYNHKCANCGRVRWHNR